MEYHRGRCCCGSSSCLERVTCDTAQKFSAGYEGVKKKQEEGRGRWGRERRRRKKKESVSEIERREKVRGGTRDSKGRTRNRATKSALTRSQALLLCLCLLA
jgi:hypothetical protein